MDMKSHLLDAPPDGRPGGDGGHPDGAVDAEEAVTALYQAHGLTLLRTAQLLLGERQAAEDVVQEAFCGLFRRWSHLSDPSAASRYLRTSVVNGCRSALRRRIGRRTHPAADPGSGPAAPAAASAELTVLRAEEFQAVMAAIRRLPPRQRETLILRYYLDLAEAEIAAVMGVGPSTVRSALHRALASVARMLEEK